MKRQQKRRSSSPKSRKFESDSRQGNSRYKSAPKGKQSRYRDDDQQRDSDRPHRGKYSRDNDNDRPRRGKFSRDRDDDRPQRGNYSKDRNDDRPRRGKFSRENDRDNRGYNARDRNDRSRGNDDRPRNFNRPQNTNGREIRGRNDSAPQQDWNSNEEIDQNRDDLIFGRHTVMAAIEHGRTLNKIWVLSQLRRNSKVNDLLMNCKSKGTVIDEVSGMRLDQLTGHATHQGIVAQVGACEYVEFDDLVTQAKANSEAPVLIAIDGITDPHNLGAIIRSAEALGTQGLVIPQRRSASVGATVAKVAAGALESLPISRVVNLNQALEALKEDGFWIYGLTLEADLYINQVDLSGPVVLLIGSEGKGLSKVTQKHCDETVKIPLAGETQSLNASVATGVGIYEIFRQRFKH